MYKIDEHTITKNGMNQAISKYMLYNGQKVYKKSNLSNKVIKNYYTLMKLGVGVSFQQIGPH